MTTPEPKTDSQQKAPNAAAAPVPTPPEAPGSSGRPWLVPLLGLVAMGGIAAWVVTHWGLEETDNAQVQAHLTEIASRVPGTITRVLVQDDQAVSAGQLLVQLDDREGRAQLAQAEADLLQARREAGAMAAQAGSSASTAAAAESQAFADQLAARSELGRAEVDLRRLEALAREGGVSQQEADRARAAYSKAQAAFSSSEATRQTAQAREGQVGVDVQKAGAARARITQAQAALARQRLELAYTRIVAPSAGRIGSHAAEPGRQVLPGQPLMTLVGLVPWVEANFKETQLTALRPGQPAEVRIDAWPDRQLRGQVIGIAPASGARFALLPPDNASGNFTKVVQRVTVRIALDPQQIQGLPLVPGLSASVRVRRR